MPVFTRLATAVALLTLVAACDVRDLRGLVNALEDGRAGSVSGSTKTPGATAGTKPAEDPVDQPLVATAKQRFAQEGKDPEAATRLWFDALILYVNHPTRATGRVLMNAFTADEGWETGSGARFFLDKVENAPYTFFSYYKGTSPENRYNIDMANAELNVARHEPGTGGYTKVFVTSSGADSPRPLTLKQSDDGLYRASEFSSLYVGIRPPKGL